MFVVNVEAQTKSIKQISLPTRVTNSEDLSPSEHFEKVALDDLEQNKRLVMAFNKSNRTYKLGQRDDGERKTKVRFVICALGLVALAMSQMSRMVLYLSITQMVEQPSQPVQNDASGNLLDGSCPWPEEQLESDLEICTTSQNPELEQETDRPEHATTETDLNLETSFTTLQSLPSLILDDKDNPQNPPDEVVRDIADIDELSDQINPLPAITVKSKNLTESTSADAVTYPRYQWSIKQQNVLLGGFFYSYFVFMVIGGRLAEVYGAKYVLMLSVAGSAIINLATPWMAETSFVLLVMSRVLMGAIQAGVFPGMYALFSKWLTMTEASIFAPLIKMNLRLGMLLGSSIPGIISGWPNVFYLTGILSVIWSVLWFVLATSDPANNAWVSKAELRLINRKKRRPIEEADSGTQKNGVQNIELKDTSMVKNNNGVANDVTSAKDATQNEMQPTRHKKRGTPWRKIITAPSVIGLIIVKLTFNYALDFLSIELPSYLKYVHHASKQRISSITSGMFLIQVLLIVFVGWLAKVAVQRKPMGLNKTGVRKLFQGLSSFGMSVTFLMLTFNDCNLTYVTILLQIGSLLSMFTSGGETMLPYDLSEEYPATIMAIANSVANISAVTITTLTAIVLGDQGGSFERWNKLIYLIAAVNFVGGLGFTLLVKAEPIDFGDDQQDAGQITGDLEGQNKEDKNCTS